MTEYILQGTLVIDMQNLNLTIWYNDPIKENPIVGVLFNISLHEQISVLEIFL